MTRMSRLVSALGLGAALALVGPTVVAAEAASTPVSSPAWRACTKKLDGITTKLGAKQRTVTIVNQTSKTKARVSFWVRTDSRCSMTRKFLTKTARLGYGGTVLGTQRKQGTGTTPRGTYTMTEAFGNGAAPKTSMPYHRVKTGDYWVGDNKSSYYNSLRNKSQGGFRWKLVELDQLLGEAGLLRCAVPLRRGDQLQPRAGLPQAVPGHRHLLARQVLRPHRWLRRRHQGPDEDRARLPAARRQDHHRRLISPR